MSTLHTSWSTEDETLAQILKLVDGCSDVIVKNELEAQLHIFQAMQCVREAAELRALRARRSRRNPKPV